VITIKKLASLAALALALAAPSARAARPYSLGWKSDIRKADAELRRRNADGTFAPGKRPLREIRADRLRPGDVILWGGAPTRIRSLEVKGGKAFITVRASDGRLTTHEHSARARLFGAIAD
jgi:hypothetical protein